MDATIQTLPDGSEALVITDGPGIEITPLEVLASYCELFNEPDPEKALVLARAAARVPVNPDRSNVWTPLFGALAEGLGEMVEAGVPAEFMPDVLEPATGSPVPGRGRVRIDAAQAAARAAIAKARPQAGGRPAPESAPPAGLSALLRGKAEQIRGHRVAFLGSLAPELKPQTVIEAPPLFDEPLQILATTLSADTINAGIVSTKGL
jgi:hypothetical protein